MLVYCSTCSSYLKGIVVKEPEPNTRVIIKCSIIGNFKNCTPINKRKFTGDQKAKVIKKMITECKSTSFVRREMAKNLMNFGDQEPSHLPSANT